jgi:RNA polymerase sigma factor (sigma-70 family)
MSPRPPTKEEDALLVRKCLDGEAEALTTLRRRYNGDLVNILLSRGATVTECDDLLADLWDDCVSGGDDHPSLLEKFSGRCAVRNWLATVATRRWIDLRRRRGRHVESGHAGLDGTALDILDSLPAVERASRDEALANLLLESLRAAFRSCTPQALLLLRLVYLHGLTQREVCRMLGWTEARVSRTLSGAMQEIEKATLRYLGNRDPLLKLTWADFVELCEVHQTGFL